MTHKKSVYRNSACRWKMSCLHRLDVFTCQEWRYQAKFCILQVHSTEQSTVSTVPYRLLCATVASRWTRSCCSCWMHLFRQCWTPTIRRRCGGSAIPAQSTNLTTLLFTFHLFLLITDECCSRCSLQLRALSSACGQGGCFVEWWQAELRTCTYDSSFLEV